MTPTEHAAKISSVESASETLAALLDAARKAAKDSDHARAKAQFSAANQLMGLQKGPNPPPDPFVIQQLSLATYKSKQPSVVAALEEAWQTLSVLSPATSTDPETLGIAGAIQKRKWEATKERRCLDDAIELYGRGFEVRRDYYNGENYATCLDLRAREQSNPEEADYDRKTARRVRLRVRESLAARLLDEATRGLEEHLWMLATMANVLYALGEPTAQDFEAAFLAKRPAEWQLDTFKDGKNKALAVAAENKR
jgi:hypothetical protein